MVGAYVAVAIKAWLANISGGKRSEYKGDRWPPAIVVSKDGAAAGAFFSIDSTGEDKVADLAYWPVWDSKGVKEGVSWLVLLYFFIGGEAEVGSPGDSYASDGAGAWVFEDLFFGIVTKKVGGAVGYYSDAYIGGGVKVSDFKDTKIVWQGGCSRLTEDI